MPRKAKPLGKKRGNPPKPIDWKEVDSLLECQCSGLQIAAALNICHDTLYDRCQSDKGVLWSEYIHSKKETGKSKLLKKQFEVAMSGNSSLLVHLGTHVLEQGKEKEKVSPTEDITSMRHEIMMLKHENAKLKEEANANQPQAGSEFQRSDA